jgi:hypothetical protein
VQGPGPQPSPGAKKRIEARERPRKAETQDKRAPVRDAI